MTNIYTEDSDQILRFNEMIGRFCKALPELEYCVGEPGSYTYCPKNTGYYPDPYSQQKECERWLKEYQEKKYNNHENLAVKKIEWWPWYNQDYNKLMQAVMQIAKLHPSYSFSIYPSLETVSVFSKTTTESLIVNHTSEDLHFISVFYKTLIELIELIQTGFTPAELNVQRTCQVIKSMKLPLRVESHAQADLVMPLFKLGYQRHFQLDPENIPDFFHPQYGIAIEVKVKGVARDIFKQCERYCNLDEVKKLILCTNKTMGFPQAINGKPCYFINIGKAWL